MPFSGLDKALSELGIPDVQAPPLVQGRKYSGFEIVLLAIELEKLGYVFYKSAQNKASTQQVADIFKMMAGEEMEHIRVLNKEIAPIFQNLDYFWENEQVTAEYLMGSTEINVFPGKSEVQKITDSIRDEKNAVEKCIEGEIKAIHFYKSILDATENQEGRTAILRILEEERKHVEKLENLKKTLS